MKINVTALSKAIGRSLTWTSLVLHGKRKSTKTREAIAKALGKSIEELWGEEK